MIEIRRADGELCGHVRRNGDQWEALVVFGVRLGIYDDEASATAQVRSDGLAALHEHWLLATDDGDELVLIQEANPDGVRIVIGYYSMPGTPTRWISRKEIDSGAVTLRRQRNEPPRNQRTPPSVAAPTPWPDQPGGPTYTDAEVEHLLNDLRGDH